MLGLTLQRSRCSFRYKVSPGKRNTGNAQKSPGCEHLSLVTDAHWLYSESAKGGTCGFASVDEGVGVGEGRCVCVDLATRHIWWADAPILPLLADSPGQTPTYM